MTVEQPKMNAVSPAPHETVAKGLVSGALWNVAGLSAVLASNLMIIPIAISAIGTVGFGEAIFALALSSPLMLIGTILGQAVASIGATHVGRSDNDQFYGILASALLLCTIGVVVFGSVLAILITVVPSPQQTMTALPFGTMLVAIAGVGLRQFGIIFQGALVARKDYRKLSKLVIVIAAIEFSSVFLATMILPSVYGYLAALAVSAAVSLCCWVLAMRSAIGCIFYRNSGLILYRSKKLLNALSAILEFTKWQGTSAVSGIIVNQSNPVLLGFLAPPSVLAHFNVAARLEQAISAVFTRFSEVLLPHFGYMRDDTAERLSHHFLISSFVISSLGSLLMAPMIPWSEAVMSLWIGKEFGEAGGLQLRVLATGGLINMAGAVFTFFALGTGRVELAARIVVQYAIVTVTLSVTIITLFGAYYAGVGLVLGSIFNVVRRWQVGREFLAGHSQGTIVMLTLWPMALAIVLSYLLVLLDITMPESWFGLLWRYCATSCAILGAIVITLSGMHEGRKIQSQVFSICLKYMNISKR